MKKNKLYTANKWNRPAFMPKENLFLNGGNANALAQADYQKNPWNYTQDYMYGNGSSITDQYLNSKNAFGISKRMNPFSKANLGIAPGGSALKGVGSAMGSALIGGVAGMGAQIIGDTIGGIAGAVGNGASSLIGGKKKSGAGSAVQSVTGGLGNIVGGVPIVGGLAKGALDLVGGVVGGTLNGIFGSELNEEKIAEVTGNNDKRKAENDAFFGINSTDELFDSIGNLTGAMAFTQDDIGEDGWFSSDAADKFQELQAEQQKVNKMRNVAVGSTVGKVNRNQFITNMKHNITAYGGPLDMGGGALDYGLAMDYLTMKKQQNEAKNRVPGISPMPAINTFGHGGCFNPFALGGDVQMHGADFTNGLISINAGGSHSENPNDGVQLGVDPEGTPNLVEEGETVFDDYVYSNRILADAQTKERFGLPRKKDITFADISKKLEKESSERPNDPISQAGLKAQMHQLADEQERQKQEMDAQRAKAAFEALSPEEQVAVMENAAQQEAMAEQAAMQQPSPEEIAVAQQQQAMADGSQVALGQETQPMMAEGGKINRFDWGGIADLFTNPDAAIIASKGKNRLPWNAKKGDYAKQREAEQDYKDWTQYVLDNWDSEQVQNYLKALDERAGGKHLSYAAEDAAAREAARKYWTDARQDGKWGYYHYTPTWEEKAKEVLEEKAPAVTPEARVFHAMDGDDYDGYIEGELDPNVVGAEVRRETLPNGDTVIYHGRAKTSEEKKAEEEKGVAPKHRAEWLRYAGLFGPAVGLGMMAAGVGRPDTAQLDAAVAGAGDVNTADWKPLGNYLTYRPLDIWFEQNRLNANARATDRAIMNNASPIGTKMAGLLAAGYNDQIASGNLFRQAQEYNDNLRKQVAEFNRGTDQFNSEQYGATSRFNADAYNNARRANAKLRLQAAAQKMDADAGWYNSLYGNIAGLFKGIGDIGTENFRMNRIGEMAARGDFGTATDETYGFEPYLTRSNRKSKKNR